MVSKVYMICNAYESGIGHGLQQDGMKNPYSVGSDEREAWGIGYQEGNERMNSRRRAAGQAVPDVTPIPGYAS